MTLQLSGAISFADIQTIFGGTNPIGLNEYYTNDASGFTTGVSGLPSTGSSISLQQFYGKAKNSSLYAFTTHTFTNAGATGRTGPIISQVRSAYSTATWAQNNSYLSMTTQGIQEWTVPATGSYTIDVAGARGGNGGGGARMIGTFSFTQSQIIKVLVGQQGAAGGGYGGGGGGGTFVVTQNNSALIIAGGGGGAGHDRSITRNGGVTSQTGQDGFDTYFGTGGTEGNGGNPSSCGSCGGQLKNAGGGGGLNTNGVSAVDPVYSGASFTNGGQGGPGVYFGGFGGGAGNNNTLYACTSGGMGGGGGGGYSGGGGGGGNCNGDGGGGGSLNNGTNATNTGNANAGHGYVTITANFTIPLYTFTTHTFTNADSFGANGPILSQCRTSYSSASWTQDTTNNYLNMTTRGIQQWKVPATGTYTIEMAGAAGGFICTNSTARPGYGYKISANISLTQGSVLNIVVGQRGVGWPSGNTLVATYDKAAGGGGASSVFEGSTLYMIAAGGNGQSWDNHTVPDPDGQSTGATNTLTSQGRGYKGATFNANGDDGDALSILNGAVGGNRNGGYASAGVYSAGGGLMFAGGFGGGGGTNPYEGGGGGGYQGGIPKATNVYATTYPSQGATSYIAGTLTAASNLGTNTSGTLSDYTSLQGYVKITKV